MPPFKFPNTPPRESAVALWGLQLTLMQMAEELLGSRDRTKKLYQPSFDPAGPHVRNTPTLDGAFAELSPNAAGFWPTALYEMAHETVHLLNPSAGPSNALDEGIAVAFSVHAQRVFEVPIQVPKLATYAGAFDLVKQLPGGEFPAARRVRESYGSLKSVSFEDLTRVFADTDPSVLLRLVQSLTPR